jgi:ABC-2 type transport system permease protein
VADLTLGPGTGEQLRLVAWLRWRTLRNSLANKNKRLDMIGMAVSAVFSSLLVIGVAVALLAGTLALFSRHQEKYFGLVFLGLLVWWQLFPIMLAGFAPQFAFRSLLRFPIRFPVFYLVGLVYGLADAAAIAAVIWMAAMVAGTLAAAPASVPAMIVACALFGAMNVTIERLVGAWLEKLLSKRRSREILFTVFILSMISLQFVNPLLRRYGNDLEAALERFLPYLWILPSSFAGDTVALFTRGHPAAAAVKLAGLALYLFFFSALLWRRYATLYSGEELSETSAPRAREKRAAAEVAEEGDSLGFLPPQILAVFRKELRYLKRNTFLFFSLFIPPLMMLFFSLQFAGSHLPGFQRRVSPDLFFPGMMAYLILLLMAPSYNAFAHESKGIQLYFTSPVRFREVLIAKNLVTIAIVFVETVLCAVLVGVQVGFPSPPILLATFAAMLFSVLGQLTIANWASLSFPKKMEFGKMQGQRNSGMSVFIMFGVQLLLAGIGSAILFSGSWTGNRWLPAEIFAALGVAALGGYFAALDAFSSLAERKKEVLIETLCR